jgi:prepilin-type N-terminal cleavage/methylation domain-containing protein
MDEAKTINRKSTQRGFSLIELMFAVFVLVTAVLGGLVMVVIGIGRNGSNRMDTTATNVAQTVLEDIAGVPAAFDGGAGVPVANNPQLPIPDCAGNNWVMKTAPGGAGLTATGDIDYTQGPADGYQMNYVVCNNGVQTVYDVRWNVQMPAGSWSKLVTVAARQPMAIKQGTLFYMPPVTLRTVVN